VVDNLFQYLKISAQRDPDAVAVSFEGTELSYRQLLELSRNIAGSLKTAGIAKGKRVLLAAPKSHYSLASVFAILSLEAAYVPVDHLAPAARNNFIAKDCGVNAIICSSSDEDIFKDFTKRQTLPGDLIILLPEQLIEVKGPDNLAYIIYTSGSTGTPKGAMFTHEAAQAFISWGLKTFQPSAADVFASLAPFHFDLSIFDIYVAAAAGACLTLISAKDTSNPLKLAAIIAEEKISICYSTPTLLRLLTAYGKMQNYTYTSLRYVLFAGEVYPSAQLKELRQFWNNCSFYNLYGPTETNVCTWYSVPKNIPHELPIGVCCDHYQYRLEQKEQGLELWISGPGLMSGYCNRAVEDTFREIEGRRWYPTGDIIELTADGEMIFLGRSDRMIKRKGYRIELAEIELQLSEHPEILSCAALSHKNLNSETEISVFFSSVSTVQIDELELRRYCSEMLPSYMIPDNFIFLEEMPQTSSGKIDLQTLQNKANGFSEQ
jgi:amino acid adenylation domain-containing protein